MNFNSEMYAGLYINNARKKFNSSDYWEYEIIEYCTKEKLNEREIYYIEKYKSYDNKFGYNLSTGGNGSRGYKWDEESKIRLSEALKGRKLTVEHCKKISERMKGRTGELNPFFGKHHTDKVKEKLSTIRKNKIYQLNKDDYSIIKMWESAIDAAKEFNITKETITMCANLMSRVRSAAGFKWCKVEEYDEWIEIDKQRQNKFIKSYERNSKFRKILLQIDIETNIIIKEWESIKECCNKCGFSEAHISQCCNGIRNKHKGYKWRFK